ncbi:hypothetical protein [Streptomyces niveiscabiei]
MVRLVPEIRLSTCKDVAAPMTTTRNRMPGMPSRPASTGTPLAEVGEIAV